VTAGTNEDHEKRKKRSGGVDRMPRAASGALGVLY
jgi:hypothetical protein